jgi:hypothetical protein
VRFENDFSAIECGCCPECLGIIPPHCEHCPRNGKDAAAIENAHDYSHLIGDPGLQRDTASARFDGLLTDFDRMLLIGMHIVWQ